MAEKKSNKWSKSGVSEDSYQTTLGGMPPKKSVEEIEKANNPKKAPDSVRA